MPKESHPSFLVRLADLLVSLCSFLSFSLLHKNLPDRQPPDQSAIELESHITSSLSLLLFSCSQIFLSLYSICLLTFFFPFFPRFPSLSLTHRQRQDDEKLFLSLASDFSVLSERERERVSHHPVSVCESNIRKVG